MFWSLWICISLHSFLAILIPLFSLNYFFLHFLKFSLLDINSFRIFFKLLIYIFHLVFLIKQEIHSKFSLLVKSIICFGYSITITKSLIYIFFYFYWFFVDHTSLSHLSPCPSHHPKNKTKFKTKTKSKTKPRKRRGRRRRRIL